MSRDETTQAPTEADLIARARERAERVMQACSAPQPARVATASPTPKPRAAPRA